MPGRRNYIYNIISACSQVDVSILVVSQVNGEFEIELLNDSITRGHLFFGEGYKSYCRIVCVTKMDLLTEDMAQERFNYVVAGMSKILKMVLIMLVGCNFDSMDTLKTTVILFLYRLKEIT